MQSFERPLSRKLPAVDEWQVVAELGQIGLRADNDTAALPTGWKVTVDNVRCRADAGR